MAYNILRCPEDAEEIVEDTYFAAWNAIPPEIPRMLKHFLSRITRNLSYSRLDYLTAKRRSHITVLLSELEECLPDHRNSLDGLMEAKQIGASLNAFLGTHDPQDCAVFLCRYFHSMTIPEISKKYGIPERRIKYRLSCLRRELRQYLEKEGIAV